MKKWRLLSCKPDKGAKNQELPYKMFLVILDFHPEEFYALSELKAQFVVDKT
jgi:hypothetical protein